jgi:hypothetical protein
MVENIQAHARNVVGEHISLAVSIVLKYDAAVATFHILLDAAREQNERYERQAQV